MKPSPLSAARLLIAAVLLGISTAHGHPLDAENGHLLAQNTAPPPAFFSGSGSAGGAQPRQAAAFAVFAPKVTVRWDKRWLYVEGDGIPAHPMMTGITAWQQQVPVPQPYTKSNAWQIPLTPVPAAHPRTIKNQFLRGAIALAVNGIPIFNPQNNRGEISAQIGELDQWGGHCGRADDYHYHAAPLHLQDALRPGMPLAYALDGYPILGLTEPDGAAPTGLDEFNGHERPGLGYHYHASKKYPYVNGGFHGEVVELEGQVDPQPRARPIRPALQALRGAKITGLEAAAQGVRRLSYQLNGEKRAVIYSANPDGTFAFEFENGREGVVKEVYSAARGGGGGGGRRPQGGEPGPEGRPPESTRPADGPRRNADQENGPRKPWIQVHGAELDANGDGAITRAEFLAEARRTFNGYDINRDGRLTREEYSGPGGVRSPMGGFVKEHAAQIDANADGIITETEFLEDVGRMFDKMDTHTDGTLTPQEWRDLPTDAGPPNRRNPKPNKP